MPDFADILSDAIRRQICLKLVLSGKASHETDANADGLGAADKITVRPVVVGGKECYQLAARHGRRETHENVPVDVVLQRIEQLFGKSFSDCHLFTTEADYTAHSRRDGSIKVSEKPPTAQPGSRTHNRTKQYLIPEDTPCRFLAEIGVMTPAGKVKAKRYSKFRQINRFLELVNDVVPHLDSDGPLRVVDFGSGKSYLTFALHHLLASVHGRTVDIVGLDRERSVVEDCVRIAERLECDGLRFEVGDIAAHQADGPIDLAVSLHACDTATDDSLAQAIGWQARVILAVPCCQHELAAKLNSGPLAPIAEQGILKERFAATATDALRAHVLEIHGYRTQVVEFIDMEHTAKNLLIRAIRRENDAPKSIEQKKRSYEEFKNLLGVDTLYLETILGPSVDSVQ